MNHSLQTTTTTPPPSPDTKRGDVRYWRTIFYAVGHLTAAGHQALAGWLLLSWRCRGAGMSGPSRLYSLNDTLPSLRRYLLAKRKALESINKGSIPLACQTLCEQALHAVGV